MSVYLNPDYCNVRSIFDFFHKIKPTKENMNYLLILRYNLMYCKLIIHLL